MSAVVDRPRLTVPISGRDHVRGSASAQATLLEYGDYECPFCAAAHGEVKQLLLLMGDEVTFAYRHFPLTQIHPRAQPAAEAAEAAGKQGAFWEMHDLLFEHPGRLSIRDLLGYAEMLRLDMTTFALALEDHRYEPRVREDFMSGIRSGVNGTPTFFVNGYRHNGGYDMRSLLDAMRTRA
jgi:protein-disulfide isomerase